MHTETLAPTTKMVFDLLSGQAELKPFYLSGGTALALHLGHRESEDLDFFTKESFNPQVLQQQLENSLKLTDITQSPGTLNGYTNNVKLQFLHYPYKFISKPSVWKGMTISSIADIACTKLITISSRGSKKDFIDLFFILQNFSLTELFELLPQKYSEVDYNLMHILKSLVYFDDADVQPSPKMHKNISWPEIKRFISDTVKNFNL